MSIISKETLDKFTKEEKEAIREFYKGTESDILKTEYEELFGKENLQPEPLTYEEVAMELFKDGSWQIPGGYTLNFTSPKQGEKLLAINKLLNVAKFLNKGWKPDWRDEKQQKFSFIINQNGELEVDEFYLCSTFVYFPCPDYVNKAIQILGEETIKLALSTDY